MWLFFGDSLTEGQNCDCSFTDFLAPKGDVVMNLGVSGTTIGEYSIYPVDGNSLLSMIGRHVDDIKQAKKIFIEYGSNDVSAIMCGFATVQTVIVSLVKALDWIRQINPDSKIYFLQFGDPLVVRNRATRMCDYLQYDYFKQFKFTFPVSVYICTYNEIIDKVRKICDIITIFDAEMISDEYISDDGIHPNVKGHKRIAFNILEQI